MIAVEQILDFITAAKADARVRPLHISLYLAIFQQWVYEDCKNPVRVSRRRIMTTAKIGSIVTYHKGIHELCKFKYISYCPSFDPRTKSEVFLLPIRKEAVHEGTASES